MSLQFCTQVAAFTSKKHAGLWIGLAIATLALGLAHFQPVHDDDVGACMLEDIITASTSQTPQTSIGEDSGAAPTELELLEPLEARCASLNKEFLNLQKDVPTSLPFATKLLQDLRNFDVQYAITMSYRPPAYESHNASDHNATANQEWQLAQKALVDSKVTRTVTRICFLQLVTAARRLTASLPREGGNANGALGCAAGMLKGIEERAVRELELEGSAQALSCLGVHWSVLAVSDRSSAHLFGSGPMPSGKTASAWVQDSWGTVAPADMVHAEDLLSRSVQGQGSSLHKRQALSIVHAHRLKEHAKALESYEQHSAAARRYQSMAKLAEEGGSAPLSAYALSHLSHTLKMHGSQEEALAAAKGAFDLTMDPLAQFVLATVRLSSGLLTTDALMKGAEGQLRAVAGLLPTDELEMERAKVRNEMLMWQWISNGNVNKCLWTRDVAKFLICTMCKFMF